MSSETSTLMPSLHTNAKPLKNTFQKNLFYLKTNLSFFTSEIAIETLIPPNAILLGSCFVWITNNRNMALASSNKRTSF